MFFYCPFLSADPPEVFPLDQTNFTRNESDEFIIECSAFGVPLPTIYWIPSHIQEELGSPLDQLLSEQDVNTFLNSVSNVSRLFGAKSRCLASEGSGQHPQGSDACSYNTNGSNDCSVASSLCSVPCVVDISSNHSRLDEKGRSIVVSRLRICNLLKSDELSYTCVAVNNISNVIDTAEGAYANLIIQGQTDCFIQIEKV